jgi:hypothetical protein
MSKLSKEQKERDLLLHASLMHGDRKVTADAFRLMAQKHYKGWRRMMIEFYCQVMQMDNCKNCVGRRDCCDSKFDLNGEE